MRNGSRSPPKKYFILNKVIPGLCVHVCMFVCIVKSVLTPGDCLNRFFARFQKWFALLNSEDLEMIESMSYRLDFFKKMGGDWGSGLTISNYKTIVKRHCNCLKNKCCRDIYSRDVWGMHTCWGRFQLKL